MATWGCRCLGGMRRPLRSSVARCRDLVDRAAMRAADTIRQQKARGRVAEVVHKPSSGSRPRCVLELQRIANINDPRGRSPFLGPRQLDVTGHTRTRPAPGTPRSRRHSRAPKRSRPPWSVSSCARSRLCQERENFLHEEVWCFFHRCAYGSSV